MSNICCKTSVKLLCGNSACADLLNGRYWHNSDFPRCSLLRRYGGSEHRARMIQAPRFRSTRP